MALCDTTLATRGAAAALTLSAVLAASSAEAFWIDAFCDHCEHHTAENRLWPEQYVGADRCRTTAPFDVMIRNGWRRQNLLGSHHFNEDASQLTDAGKLRVQWILTQNPPAHRQLFVERSISDETTQARLDAANEFASVVSAEGGAAIVETHILSEGRPAVTVDFVNTTFRENMPIPALPAHGAAQAATGE